MKVLKLSPNAELNGYQIPYQTSCEEMQILLEQRGCDSIWIPRERPEFIVYNSDQVKHIREVQYLRDTA